MIQSKFGCESDQGHIEDALGSDCSDPIWRLAVCTQMCPGPELKDRTYPADVLFVRGRTYSLEFSSHEPRGLVWPINSSAVFPGHYSQFGSGWTTYVDANALYLWNLTCSLPSHSPLLTCFFTLFLACSYLVL